MADLPNPFSFGEIPCSPEQAVASSPQVLTCDVAADLSCIGEIFVGARKLEQIPGIFDQAAYTPADEIAYVELKLRDDPYAADLINIPEGMWGEFDPPPLFLQMAV
jgi:hypothetical protein